MLLVIDAGNSNFKFGLFRGVDLAGHWRLLTDHTRTAQDYGAELRKLFELSGIDPKEIKGVAIASVVPPLDDALESLVQECFGLTPLFVDHTSDTGLKILYDSPSQLGADRIVDAVAAVAKYGAPCIVVDFGTATTFNAVNAAREYLGGVIAPGVMISAEALFSRTAQLPRVEIKEPKTVIARSTFEAIQSGLYYGYVGLVDRVLEKMIAEMKEEARVVATGGMARPIAGASRFIENVDATLTLDGLRIVYDRNKQ